VPEDHAVDVRRDDWTACDAATGDVIDAVRDLDARWARHASTLARVERADSGRHRIDTIAVAEPDTSGV
jgi:hypothetical protein